EARKNAQATVKRVLTLADAPIAMLLCMRTYFQSILPRAVGVPRQLGRLTREQLLAVVEHRIGLDTDAVQRALRAPAARTTIDAPANRAETPLALITWIRWVAESRQGFSDPIEAHAARWRGSRYADFAKAIEATLKLFAQKRAEGSDSVSQKDLLAALDGDAD